jgi:RNA polymerase sigma-70 factor, ECF subfamily
LPILGGVYSSRFLYAFEAVPERTSLYEHGSKKFLNNWGTVAVFMFEDLRVAAGQLTVNEATGLAQTNDDALELAVRTHARLVYRIAFSVLRNHYDAEDATQETFLRVLRYRRKLGGVGDPRLWLARIAWRVAVTRRQKTPDVALADAPFAERLRSEGAAADDTVFGREISGVLEGLIAALPAKLRQPLTLSTIEEMSTPDIAAVLGITEAAVRSRLFRAREILKERLSARLGATDET